MTAPKYRRSPRSPTWSAKNPTDAAAKVEAEIVAVQCGESGRRGLARPNVAHASDDIRL